MTETHRQLVHNAYRAMLDGEINADLESADRYLVRSKAYSRFLRHAETSKIVPFHDYFAAERDSNL